MWSWNESWCLVLMSQFLITHGGSPAGTGNRHLLSGYCRVPSNTSTSSSTWWVFLRSASSGSCSWISPLVLYQMRCICYLQKHCSLHLEYHALSLGWCRTCWPGDAEGSLGHHSQLSSHLWPLRITSLLWQPSHLVRLNRKEVGTPPSSLPGCSTCYIL